MTDPYDSPMMQYNQHVLDWRELTVAYSNTVEEAASLDSRYKTAWAKALVKAKHDDPKMPVDVLKALADSDPAVEELSIDRFVMQARVDALKKKLDWARAYADNLRTQVVNDRAENALASQAGAGPGRTTFGAQQPPPRQEQWYEPPAADSAGPTPDGMWAPHPFRQRPGDQPGICTCGLIEQHPVHDGAAHRSRDEPSAEERRDQAARHFEAQKAHDRAPRAPQGDEQAPTPPSTSPEGSDAATGRTEPYEGRRY